MTKHRPKTRPVSFALCRRCKVIIEETESGFVASYCAKCDPNNEVKA